MSKPHYLRLWFRFLWWTVIITLHWSFLTSPSGEGTGIVVVDATTTSSQPPSRKTTSPRPSPPPPPAKTKKPLVAHPVQSSPLLKRPRPFRRWSERAFMAADLDHDGTIDFEEVYELALRLHILLNRQAPIRPPTRETVWTLFTVSDRDQSLELNQEEFYELATVVLQRSLWRIVAFKIVTLVGAPILAQSVVHWWTQQPRPWLPNLISKVVTNPRHLDSVTSKGFGRTVLLILFIITLGKLVLAIVDFFLHLWLLQQQKDSGVDVLVQEQQQQQYRDQPWNRQKFQRRRQQQWQRLHMKRPLQQQQQQS